MRKQAVAVSQIGDGHEIVKMWSSPILKKCFKDSFQLEGKNRSLQFSLIISLFLYLSLSLSLSLSISLSLVFTYYTLSLLKTQESKL